MPLTIRPVLLATALLVSASHPVLAQAQRWATVWSGADQGPYPSGYATAQPDQSFTFPRPEAGSHDQTFRLVIRPDVWGRQMRFRFSNAFGAKPLTIDTAFAGQQLASAALVPGTNRPLTFGGKKTVQIAPGAQAWSDPVALPFVHDPFGPEQAGRNLAISFHVPGDSGPMTWHAAAMTTSYVSAPDAGAVGELEDESAFPGTTTSWFFLDAADAMLPADTRVIVCLGDSITDGLASTLNFNDRWPDVLSRRLHAEPGAHVAVVDAGLAGNQVLGPSEYSAAKPFVGGPSAVARLDRDVLALSGVTDVLILEGINDLGAAGAGADAVAGGLRGLAERIRAKVKGVRVLAGTLTSSRGSNLLGYGNVETDTRRHALNDALRKPGLFDAVVDFDAATVDTQTGELRPDFIPSSTAGGPGDKLHPNHAGYLAMGGAVDLNTLVPAAAPKPRPRPRPRPRPAAPNAADPAPDAAVAQ